MVGIPIPIDVFYDGEPVGKFWADLLVEDTVIVELKSVRAIAPTHEVQLVHYLTATGKPIGLLLNFGETGVEARRKVRQLPSKPKALRPDPVNPVDPVKER